MDFAEYLKTNIGLYDLNAGEEVIYEFIAMELESGDLRKGLWTKALAEADWDESKAKSHYVKYIFEALVPEFKAYARALPAVLRDQTVVIRLRRQGLTEEDIEYLRNPITAAQYKDKYRVSSDKIQTLISQKKLKGALVNGTLWVQDIKP